MNKKIKLSFVILLALGLFSAKLFAPPRGGVHVAEGPVDVLLPERGIEAPGRSGEVSTVEVIGEGRAHGRGEHEVVVELPGREVGIIRGDGKPVEGQSDLLIRDDSGIGSLDGSQDGQRTFQAPRTLESAPVNAHVSEIVSRGVDGGVQEQANVASDLVVDSRVKVEENPLIRTLYNTVSSYRRGVIPKDQAEGLVESILLSDPTLATDLTVTSLANELVTPTVFPEQKLSTGLTKAFASYQKNAPKLLRSAQRDTASLEALMDRYDAMPDSKSKRSLKTQIDKKLAAAEKSYASLESSKTSFDDLFNLVSSEAASVSTPPAYQKVGANGKENILGTRQFVTEALAPDSFDAVGREALGKLLNPNVSAAEQQKLGTDWLQTVKQKSLSQLTRSEFALLSKAKETQAEKTTGQDQALRDLAHAGTSDALYQSFQDRYVRLIDQEKPTVEQEIALGGQLADIRMATADSPALEVMPNHIKQQRIKLDELAKKWRK